MNNERTFASCLRAEMARTDKTAAALAVELKVSRALVSKWRNGHQSPRVNEVAAVAQALGCVVADLLP